MGRQRGQMRGLALCFALAVVGACASPADDALTRVATAEGWMPDLSATSDLGESSTAMGEKDCKESQPGVCKFKVERGLCEDPDTEKIVREQCPISCQVCTKGGQRETCIDATGLCSNFKAYCSKDKTGCGSSARRAAIFVFRE